MRWSRPGRTPRRPRSRNGAASRRALSHSGPVLLIMEQNRKAVPRMKIVVLKSPRCLAGLLRLVFGIRNN